MTMRLLSIYCERAAGGAALQALITSPRREDWGIKGGVTSSDIDAAMHLHYHFMRKRYLSSEPVMPAALETESTLTDRYQTTVPETVRRALGLGKRDKIRYSIRPGGEVVITRAETDEANDPLIGQFLAFLARDIADHPDHLRAVDTDLLRRIQSLVGAVVVDLDAPLTADDE